MTHKEIQAAADERAKTIIEFHGDPDLILMSRKWFTELAETLNYRIARIADLEQKAMAVLEYAETYATAEVTPEDIQRFQELTKALYVAVYEPTPEPKP